MNKARVLARLASSGAVLAPIKDGAVYGVFPGGDRRRRPTARLSRAEVHELVSDGAIREAGAESYALNEAGGARVRREAAAPGEEFLAQHASIVDRSVISGAANIRVLRGFALNGVIKRLAALRDHADRPWLSDAEIEAAARLRADWEAAQIGFLRGSDWSAPPRSGTARGSSAAVENAMTRQSDARRRVNEALNSLAPPLRRAVERGCLHEDGMEALERAEGWPQRSGKLALKLGLAQLATR